jgi:hypothetical protein
MTTAKRKLSTVLAAVTVLTCTDPNDLSIPMPTPVDAMLAKNSTTERFLADFVISPSRVVMSRSSTACE